MRCRVSPLGWDLTECLPIAGSRPGRLCPLHGSPAPRLSSKPPALGTHGRSPLLSTHLRLLPPGSLRGPDPVPGAPGSFSSWCVPHAFHPQLTCQPLATPADPAGPSQGRVSPSAASAHQQPHQERPFLCRTELAPTGGGVSSAQVRALGTGPIAEDQVGWPVIKHPSLSPWEGASPEAGTVPGAGTRQGGGCTWHLPVQPPKTPSSRGTQAGIPNLPNAPGETLRTSQPALGGAGCDPHPAATPAGSGVHASAAVGSVLA